MVEVFLINAGWCWEFKLTIRPSLIPSWLERARVSPPVPHMAFTVREWHGVAFLLDSGETTGSPLDYL